MRSKGITWKQAAAALLVGCMFGVSGCNSRTTPPPGSTESVRPRRIEREPATSISRMGGAGQAYDFYVLNLSWSPEFCQTNPGAVECSQHLGFVVHGLWPQSLDGTYPKNCGTRPGPVTDADWQGLFPTAALAQHEWTTHGVCTPYNADTYFGLVREARGKVRIPAAFTGPTQPASDTPADIIAQFAKINTGVPPGGLALSCGNNNLTAIEICFDKNINPTACQGLRSCRANSVRIPSTGGAGN
jgi:ribonuclease T2